MYSVCRLQNSEPVPSRLADGVTRGNSLFLTAWGFAGVRRGEGFSPAAGAEQKNMG